MKRALCIFLLLVFSLGLAAKDAGKDIEAQIQRIAGSVAEIAGKQRGVLDRVALLKRRVRLDQAMLKRIRGILLKTRKKIGESEESIRILKQKEGAAISYLGERMRQQYALGLLQQYRVYFAVNSTQDLQQADIYLQVLARKDAVQIKQLRVLREEREEALKKLSSLQNSLQDQAGQASGERRTLRDEQKTLAGVLSGLRLKRKTAQQGLNERLAAARKMDRYLKDLSFRSRINLYSKSMVTEKGSLPFPCRGRVVRGYGDYARPPFNTRVPHPGLDIAAPLGTPVHAVFDGLVEYADWLSGYGYTVILRHPVGYFTVYAHLDRILVHKGEVVPQGDAIGTVGDSIEGSGTSLYFEIRRGGIAVPPSPWLKGVVSGR